MKSGAKKGSIPGTRKHIKKKNKNNNNNKQQT